jgi:polyisoprenoid-binding protein YceI
MKMPTFRHGSIASIVILALGSPAFATALDVKARGTKDFWVDAAAGRNQISIFSESTLEDFTVVCNEVTGKWRFNPQDVEQIAGEFTIKVADLRTGIALRDQHLRGPEWLDAAKYPDIVITIQRAENVSKTGPNAVSAVLVGTCSLHGATRDVRIPVKLAYLDQSPQTMARTKGDLIRLRAEFELKLSDYKIYGPPGSDTIGLKVADDLPIKVAVFGSTERPPAPLKVDKPGTPSPVGVATQPADTEPRVSVLQPPTRPAAGR